MSYTEYTDEFYELQDNFTAETAPYTMLMFDIVSSKSSHYNPNELDNLAAYMASDLEQEDLLVVPEQGIDPHVDSLYRTDLADGYNMLFFGIGDMRGMVVDTAEFMEMCAEENCSMNELAAGIVESFKLAVRYDRNLHVAAAVFQTWKWSEGAEKYPFAYCVRQLEDYSKNHGIIV